jgi:AcrR family transcriptional regulator
VNQQVNISGKSQSLKGEGVFTRKDLGSSLEAAAPSDDATSELSSRQKEVLSVVLDLMVEEGDGFSLAKVAKRASCSKETLYNWFGDRDGLLTATVQWQASKVRMPGLKGEKVSGDDFRDSLIAFADNWLTVITGDVSAALNRLAISHAGSGKSRLGEIVLQNGPLAMTSRLRPIFEIGLASNLVKFDSIDAALKTFFGLVVGDWQIRKLLGETTKPSLSGIKITAIRAVDEFLLLYGAGNTNTKQTQTTF